LSLETDRLNILVAHVLDALQVYQLVRGVELGAERPVAGGRDILIEVGEPDVRVPVKERNSMSSFMTL